MQTTRPRIHGRVFTNGFQVAIFKNIRSSAKDLDCELFYSELKRPQRLTLYLLLATDNIHIVLNINTVLIKDLKDL